MSTFAITPKTGNMAIYLESTPGTGPADWDASGSLVDHLSVDVAGLTQTVAKDGNVEDRIFASGDRDMILGLKSGGTAKSSHYLTGHGQTIADAASATETHLAKLLKLALCGEQITKTYTCSGGTATQPTLTAVTDLEEGDFLAFQDTTSPTTANSGICYIRRIINISGMTVDVDQALPFTPANGDLARSTITFYPDTAVLQDTSGTASSTASVKIEKGETTAAADKVWEMYGCVPTLSISNLTRDSQAQVELEWMCGKWLTYDDVTKTAWSTAKSALTSVQPVTIGINTTVWVQTYGTTTSVCKPVNSFDVSVGIPRARIDTLTECTANLQGLAGYTSSNADTTVKMGLARLGDDWEGVLQGSTRKVVRIACNRGPGYSWAIHFSRVQIMSTPIDKDIASNAGTEVTFRAGEDLDNSNATTEDLWKAKICIVIA